MRFLVGGYTADMEGTAEGIGLLTAGQFAIFDTVMGTLGARCTAV